MKANEIIVESAASELAKRLPSLRKHNYDTIEKLMRDIANKHNITGKALHNLFVKKYKKIPDNWIKNKLDEKSLTTEDIQKTILKRTGKNNDLSIIRKIYESVGYQQYGRKVINSTTVWINNLLPHINESMDPKIKEFYDKLNSYGKRSHVPVKIGAKLCILQAQLDIYSYTVILMGFKNPKKIVDIKYDDDKIKQVEFDDGSVFPEQYEYSTTELGYDLLNTFFFSNKDDLEKMITVIGLIKPDQYSLGYNALNEDKKSTDSDDLDIQSEVDKFADWAAGILKIEKRPEIELSMDTEEAQTNHHTGGYVNGDDSVWVYANNRNLVDILRTVFHELVHVRQGELDMIKPGSSYPGSPIEAQADQLAGKFIKIYGEQNHHIFQ
jgi:hypothetical protein